MQLSPPGALGSRGGRCVRCACGSSVRQWPITSRCGGPRTRRAPPENVQVDYPLERAGIGRDTRAPAPSIEIERDAHGDATGVLVERTYKPLVEHTLMAVAPRFTLDDRVAGLAESKRIYKRCGTTSVFKDHGISSEVLAAYQALRERGRPSVRAHLLWSPAWPSADAAPVLDLVRSWGAWLSRRGLGDEYLRVGGLYTESDYSEENRLRAATSPQTG